MSQDSQQDEPELGVVQGRIEMMSQRKLTQEEADYQMLQWKQQRDRITKSQKQRKNPKSGSKQNKQTITKLQQQKQDIHKQNKLKRKKRQKNQFNVGLKLRNLPQHDSQEFESTQDISMHVDVEGKC